MTGWGVGPQNCKRYKIWKYEVAYLLRVYETLRFVGILFLIADASLSLHYFWWVSSNGFRMYGT